MLKYLVIIYYEASVISNDCYYVGEEIIITAFYKYNEAESEDNGKVLSAMRFKLVSMMARELFISLIID